MIEFLPERAVVFQIGMWSVRWYGVLYVAAYIIGWWLGERLQRWRELRLSREQWMEVTVWVVLGVLVGGRLGYVLFYEPVYFVTHLQEVVALWRGGMSVHGGFIGVALALWWVARRLTISVWRLADVVIVPGAAGLALGRLGNVINEELYLTNEIQAVAVIYPLMLAVSAYGMLRRSLQPGMVVAFFLMVEGVLRWLLELGRAESTAGLVSALTRGQELALVTVGLGIGLAVYLARSRNTL